MTSIRRIRFKVFPFFLIADAELSVSKTDQLSAAIWCGGLEYPCEARDLRTTERFCNESPPKD